MKRPNPRVATRVPNQMAGRYWPVFLMKTPTAAEAMDRARTNGKT